MSIEILPARLANQIAAGEVVERPASVIKELIENSLDAGATHIHIDVDKGGVKKIRISDNGCGIVKNELQLALSRHATSKIKSLSDLEAIDSLGFRGEALASISSVARLTLTSKPVEQATAWQACAQGRDMEVTIQPAAHPDGTTIEVLDLFFNTPARRKFLRTDKTEFNHIDEVVRRIALANFETTFVLTHNGKMVRQYRAARDKSQYHKRVAMVCGQKFMEHAIEVDCPHDNMTLTGWLASPSFYRGQNDLCYSYVNGRMMRDKLLNHAIRQAYADLLPADTYPAFVLFLTLDHKEVDVNVHPAKHEVRFHQSRYVHDFIYSVCSKALLSGGISFEQLTQEENSTANVHSVNNVQTEASATANNTRDVDALASGTEPLKAEQQHNIAQQSVTYGRADYPSLQQVSEVAAPAYSSRATGYAAPGRISKAAVANYQQLMTPLCVENVAIETEKSTEFSSATNEALPTLWRESSSVLLHIEKNAFGIINIENSLRVLSFVKLAQTLNVVKVQQSWQAGMVSQPLLLPIVLNLPTAQLHFISQQQALFTQAGIVFTLLANNKVQIRQFPALLREQDVSDSFTRLIEKLFTLRGEFSDELGDEINDVKHHEQAMITAIAGLISVSDFTEEQAIQLVNLAKKQFNQQFISQLRLNSVPLDLTSEINQLK